MFARSFRASLITWALAVLLVALLSVGGGCSGPPEEDAARSLTQASSITDAADAADAADTSIGNDGSGTCRRVEIVARRGRLSEEDPWLNETGSSTVDPPLRFRIPAEIPVTIEGEGGYRRGVYLYIVGDGLDVGCEYLGGTELPGPSTYTFASCGGGIRDPEDNSWRSAATLRAGDVFEAPTVQLELFTMGPPLVEARLVLDDVRTPCTGVGESDAGSNGEDASEDASESGAPDAGTEDDGGGGTPPRPCSTSSECFDKNPCTKDECSPEGRCVNAPESKGVSCGDGNACNGEEQCDGTGLCIEGPSVVVDDSNICTIDACDPQSGNVTHTPVADCDPAPTMPGGAFELRTSLLGRVVTAAGGPIQVSGLNLKVFDETDGTNTQRNDVGLTSASDGSFHVRLTAFPEAEAERAPAHHVLVRIEIPDSLPVIRDAYVHPGSVADLGRIVVVPRDSKITMIDASGGTASDSQGLVEVVFPPGAVSEPTPIRITPFKKREELPARLPDATLTTYAAEFEPDGLKFPETARPTIRFANTRNFPTQLTIPVGVYDRTIGRWRHEAQATWDGSRFAYQASHFSAHDMNASAIGRWIMLLLKAAAKANSEDDCDKGSSVGLANGSLNQSFSLPAYMRKGKSYGVSLGYKSFLSFGATSTTPPQGYGVLPLMPVVIDAGGGSKMTMTCLPKPEADRILATTPGSCGGGGGTGGMCVPGTRMLPLGTKIHSDPGYGQGNEYDLQALPEGAVDYEVPSTVALPTDSTGALVAPHFVQQTITYISGGGACAGSGESFGQTTTVGQPVNVPNAEPSPLATEVRSIFVPHRHGSPFGVGWAVEEVGRVFRNPLAYEAVFMSGTGSQEHFLPRLFTKVIGGNGFASKALARDETTGDVFIASPDGKISKLDRTTGATTDILSGVAFGSDPLAMVITYVDGVRHFVVACDRQLVDVDATGTLRPLRQRDRFYLNPRLTFAWSAPGVAANNGWALYVEGNPRNPVLYRFKLSDPSPTEEALSLATGGKEDLLPTLPLSGVTFGDPHGLAFGPRGELYVADRKRNVVYVVGKNASGAIAGDSPVAQAVGDGAGRSITQLGQPRVGHEFSLPQPTLLSIADGTLWILTGPGAVAYDTVSREARWMAHDATVTGSEQTYTFFKEFEATSFAAVDRASIVLHDGRSTLAMTVRPYSSEFEPTRELSFTSAGAVLVDTNQDIVEHYDRYGRLEKRSSGTGELLLSVSYVDEKSDRIDRLTDPTGGVTQFAYDNGKLKSITDAANRTTTFMIDSLGDLTSFREPDGEVHLFTYGAHRMKTKKSPRGDLTEYTYSPDGALLTTKKPAGEVYKITSAFSQPEKRDANGELVREGSFVDYHGVTHTFTVDKWGRRESEKYVADGVAYEIKAVKPATIGDGYTKRRNMIGRVSGMTVNGLVLDSENVYDGDGRLVAINRVAGGGSLETLSSFTYDQHDRLSTVWLGPGNNSLVIDRDIAGRPVRVWEKAWSGSARRETLMTWEDDLAKTVTLHGLTTTITYDPTTKNPLSTTDTLGRRQIVTYDDAGNVKTSNDGQTTKTVIYDANNRPTLMRDAEGNETSLAYVKAGCGCSERDLVTSVHTPDLLPNQAWKLDYGAEGRLTSIFDPEGHSVHYTYAPSGEILSFTDQLNHVTAWTHDQRGRLKSMIDALGRVHRTTLPVPTATKWSGPHLLAGSGRSSAGPTALSAELADGEYQIGANGFDAQATGRGTEAASSGRALVSLYRDPTFELSLGQGWDRAGRLVKRQDRGAGLPITSEKPFASSQGEVSGDTHHEQWAPSVELPIQQFHLYSSAGPNGAMNSELSWNDEYDVTGSEGFGVWNQYNATRYTYRRQTPGGKLLGVDRFLSYNGWVFSGPPSDYEYLPTGYLKKVTNADGAHVYTYDRRGLIETLTASEGKYEFKYDAVGRNRELVYPDGHKRIQVYDSVGRMTSRCYEYVIVGRRCYTAHYDAAGNPDRLADPEGSDELTYDALNRLTKVTRSTAGQTDEVEEYSYNALGAVKKNAGTVLDDQRPKIAGGGTAGAAVPANHGGAPVTMDAAGRVTSLHGVSLQYSKNGRVVAVRKSNAGGSEAERFSYDGAGRRVARIHDATTNGVNGAPPTTITTGSQFYAYEGDNLVGVFLKEGCNSSTPFGCVRESFLYDGVDHPLRWKSPGHIVYYELDLASNVRRLRSSGDNELNDLGGYRYSAFGMTMPANAATPTPPIDQPLRWKGRWIEPFVGDVYDVRARWWSPELAIFLSIDEFANHDPTSTLWGWGHQSPVRYVDTSGRFAFIPIVWAIVALVSTAVMMGMAAPSDTSAAPANILEMALAIPGLGQAIKAGGSTLLEFLAPVIEKLAPSLVTTIRGLGKAGTKGAAVVEHCPKTSTVPADAEGAFSVSDWTGYPEGMPKPAGPFKLLTDEEYKAARAAANEANKGIREGLDLEGFHIHEIQPVKFGGSPTDPANKMLLPWEEHVGENGVHPMFWGPLQKSLE